MSLRKKKILRITAALLCAAVVCACVFGVLLVLYSAEQNKTIVLTEYTVSHGDIPSAFDGKRILHLSDLHNKDFADQLTSLAQTAAPDIIVITGDWIGQQDEDITVACRQAEALLPIAPVYYVAGNHEAWGIKGDELLAHLEEIGVTMLNGCAVDWTQEGESVQLIGMYDPEFSQHLWRDFAPLVEQERYSIFLFHRPEYFEEVASYGADLVLSGHTHGGQIRLPLIGALYAPDQGWFPKYDVGRFDCEGMTMIVSQGLGESSAIRVLTPPEAVLITLDSTQE